MSIIIASRRLSAATLVARYSVDATIVDVTSRGPEPWVRYSPFYPHGAIPVPLSPGYTAASVEGIWQELKVFAGAGIDLATLRNTTMRGIKRTSTRYGAVLGHRAGIGSDSLLGYADARYQLYLPAYRWVLDHRLQEEVADLRRLAQARQVVLLDYETNVDINDFTRPLSHASLIVRYLAGDWPA